MSNQSDSPPRSIPPSGQLHERSDDWLALVLGRDLQGATLRGMLYLAIAAVVFGTIAALVG